MDYTDALRPLFTLAAHAVRSVPDMPTGERLALRRELDALLAEAGTRARPSRPELFETARRAVRSWLDERFPGPAGSVAAADFYPSLERLLDAPDHHRHDAERRQAIEVFATCLELGYRGTNGVTDGFPAPAAFLRRCRRELAGAAFAPAVPPPLPEPAETAAGWWAMLPFWLIPIAVTMAVYAVFSTLLADLYLRIAG